MTPTTAATPTFRSPRRSPNTQIAKRLPTLGIALADYRLHVRGNFREYVSM
ncbi:hypothetical protein AB0F91_46110 [Amycolatopsis sp. NPDC023774]|uniref:hypothetical protein n=1 Tax=Amycolatopsis sp. NPDC023774 TaxID=3155015 RepID=UPI0033E29DAC